MMEKKMRFCANCGTDLGILTRGQQWQPGDTCGAPDCERAAREMIEQEREEAHRRLDDDMGWR